MYLNRITLGDCLAHLPNIQEKSVDLLLSDIPYGISLDEWDVIHNNSNSALLGKSPAQDGKAAFKRRGKPINGWSESDKRIGKEYEAWCKSWAELAFQCLKEGSPAFIFGGRRTIHHAINALEQAGFLLRDMLVWKKETAHHRAQKASTVLERRGLPEAAEAWEGWRLGNLAPIWEPIAFFMKPYRVGGTITDNLLENQLGALNLDSCRALSGNNTNLLSYGFEKHEEKIHEAQKPEKLIEHLIKLTTLENHCVLDPFMGSGTTAVVAKNTNRNFIGFERNEEYHRLANLRLIK